MIVAMGDGCMINFRLLTTATFFGLAILTAAADVPSGDASRWVVLASSQSIDDAIGIASVYQWRFDDVRVVRSSNGWLAVVAGPIPVPHGIAAAREQLVSSGGLPKDLFMSNGAEFETTLWQPERTSFPTWEANFTDGARFDVSGLSVTIDTVTDGSDFQSPRIMATKDDQLAFSSVMSSVSTSDGKSTARAVNLDPNSDVPEIVFSAYWGGAHCCTVTEIFSEVDGYWVRIEASTLDAGGYTFRDLDGDGSIELIRLDNSFLYAFAPYVYSWAPTVIEQLRDGQLSVESHDPAFATYYRRELAGMEHLARNEPSLWNSNGFLAAWVATKALLGEFEDAWPRMMASYDRGSDWPLEICSQAMSFSECPEASKVKTTFPLALKAHLQEYGYLPTSVGTTSVAAANTTDGEGSHSRDRKREETEATSSGTGFFVTAEGEILTNFHVVDGCESPLVLHGRLPPLPAVIIAKDEVNDLALLKVEKRIERFARFNMQVRLGEPVAAFGYPLSSILSSGGNFTLGSVTALTGLRDDSRYLQISAPVQPGNSGGPLVDYSGNVAGVVTGKFNALAAMIATGDIVQNVNFAIRSSTAVSFLLANGVEASIVDRSSAETRLDPPDLAEVATDLAVAVRCN